MSSGVLAQAGLFTRSGETGYSPDPALPAFWRDDLSTLAPWSEAADLLDGQPCLRTGHPLAIRLVGTCLSTLDLARDLHAAGRLADWDGVLAVSQTSGRGQTRRHWHSPPGNLYVALRLPGFLAGLTNLLPVAVGGAVVLGLESLGLPVQLKWPNDVFLNGRKIAGVLIEERGGLILAGVGVNIVSSPADHQMRIEAAAEADHLDRHRPGLSPLGLWLILAKSIREYLAIVTSAPERISYLESRLFGLGQPVRDSCGLSGVLSGLDASGAVILSTPQGLIRHLGSSLHFDWAS